MSSKIRPCTLTPKHAWQFVRNTEIKTVRVGLNGTTIFVRCKGIYRCACGERKLGQTLFTATGDTA